MLKAFLSFLISVVVTLLIFALLVRIETLTYENVGTIVSTGCQYVNVLIDHIVQAVNAL